MPHRIAILPLLGLFLLSPTPSPIQATALDTGQELTVFERAELIELLERTQAETLALIADVGDTPWRERPAEGRWSIAEIVEHLILAEGAIRSRLDAMVAAGPTTPSDDRVRPSLEEVVALGSDRSQRFEAPEPIQPTGSLEREEAIAQLLLERSKSIRYVLETKEPLRSFSAIGPIGVELDGHGWLALLGAHNLRHNLQIAETRQSLGLSSE